jgi:hypothetical protein
MARHGRGGFDVTLPDTAADPISLAVVRVLSSGHPLDVGDLKVGHTLISTAYHAPRIGRDGRYEREYWETLAIGPPPAMEMLDRWQSRFYDRESAKAWHHDVIRAVIREQEAT